MLSRAIAIFLLAFLLGDQAVEAQSPPEDFSTLLRCRNIRPYRGGRTRAVAGVPSQPNVFYCALDNIGVFKTYDYCRTWQPIFDYVPTGSDGVMSFSVSNPYIVYLGSF